MLKRILMGAGLGLALLGGTATAVHTTGAVAAQRAAIHADLKVLATESQTADADPSAPCAVDAAGSQTGDCQDSQSTAGPADSAGAAGEGDTATSDTDTVQSGDQSSPD